MGILFICVLIFILFVAAGFAGLLLQKHLTDEHKTGESKGVVGQVSGLVTLLLALVLGTLIGVSFAYYSNSEDQSRELLCPDPEARSGPCAIRTGDQAPA